MCKKVETRQIEEILGKKLADECLDEISDRIHPRDTPEFRKTLIKEIVLRYVRERDMSLKSLKDILPDDELCYVRRMENNVMGIIYDSMRKINPKRRW